VDGRNKVDIRSDQKNSQLEYEIVIQIVENASD